MGRALDGQPRWSAADVIARVQGQTRDGSIILLHDGGTSPDRIVEIVSAIVTDLRRRGFEFERLDRMIGQKND